MHCLLSVERHFSGMRFVTFVIIFTVIGTSVDYCFFLFLNLGSRTVCAQNRYTDVQFSFYLPPGCSHTQRGLKVCFLFYTLGSLVIRIAVQEG